MTKEIIKYLLTLVVLLLSVWNHTYAHASQENTPYLSIDTYNRAEQAYLGTAHVSNSESATLSSLHTDKSLRIEAADIAEEDYSFAAIKKFIESSNYLKALLYSLTLLFFLRNTNTSLLFCKHLSYTLSQRRYLLFRVFRI